MAREQCVELNRTISVGLGNATKESVVQVGGVIGIAVARFLNSRVDTGRVGVPNISPNSSQWLTGVDIDELEVRGNRNTLLAIDQVGTNILAGNVEWSNLAFRVQDGASGVGEDILFSMVSP